MKSPTITILPSKIMLLFLMLIALAQPIALQAQDDESMLSSSDDVFFMQVTREVTKVKIKLFIKDPTEVDEISIERSDIGKNSWGQCKFIAMSSVNPKDTIISIDNYPQPASVDVFYRLRLTSKDGITRVYPAVKLLAVNDRTSRN
jgi:hypothetical protein